MTPTTFLFDFWNVLLLPGYQGEKLNTELLSYIKVNLSKTQTHLLTSSPPVLLQTLDQHLSPVFTKRFTTEELGLRKTNPEIYLLVAAELSVKPEEILFVDDSSSNIQAATAAGLMTHLFSDNKSLFAYLHSLAQ